MLTQTRMTPTLRFLLASAAFALPLFAQGTPSAPYRVTVYNVAPAFFQYPGEFLPQTAAGINNAGQIAGFYQSQEELDCCGKFDPFYGYIRDFAGNVVTTNDPRQGALIVQAEGMGTVIRGINNNGTVVGTVTSTIVPGGIHAFSKAAGDVQWNFLDLPGGKDTMIVGVNNAGWMIGYSDATALYWSPGNQATTFTCSSLPGAQLVAINDAAIAVGAAGMQGFWVDLSHAPTVCHSIAVLPVSINNKGQVLGTIGTQNVIGSISSAAYQNVDLEPLPIGAYYTVSSINDNGEISGTFYDPSPNHQGLGGPIGTELYVAAPINPNANVRISRTSWHFAAHGIGQMSGLGHLFLINSGTQPALLNSIKLVNAQLFFDDHEFVIKTTNCRHVLPARATCYIDIAFTPSAVGQRIGALSVSANGAAAVPSATIMGYGLAAPVVQAAPVGRATLATNPAHGRYYSATAFAAR